MQHFLRMLLDGSFQLHHLAPQRVPLAEAPAAYRTLLEDPARPPTVVIQYG
jgi:hypothetical protein